MKPDWLKSYVKDEHLNELARGSISFLSVRIFGLLLANVFNLLISRLYGPESLGIYSLSAAALQIAMLFGRMGLDNALVRFTAEYTAKKNPYAVKSVYRRSIYVGIICSLTAGVILYVLAPIFARSVFKNQHITTAFRLIALSVLPITLLYINAAHLRGKKKIKSFSFLVNVSQYLVGSIILSGCYFFFSQDTIPVYAYAAAAFISVISSFILVSRAEAETGEGDIPLQRGEEKPIGTGKLLRTSFPMLMSGAFSFFVAQTGTIMLGIFRSETEVGIFSVGLKVAAVLTFTLTSVNSIAASKFAESWSTGDTAGLKRITNFSTRMIFWTTAPVAVIFLLIPRFLMSIFGDKATGGATALSILIIGELVNAFCGPVGTFLNMTGKQMVFQYFVLGATIVNITLNWVLIPRMGINGAAIANAAGMISWNIASVIYIKKHFNIMPLYIPNFRHLNLKKLRGEK